jgi:electron transfer flavoprotein alpha subunit
MGNVLTYCEFAGESLRSNALPGIAAARQIAEHHGGEVVVLLVGKGASAAASDAAQYASKVIAVDDAALESYLAESHAPIVKRVLEAEGASAVVATASAIGKDVMPRLAALLGVGVASDIAEVVGKNQFKRPILAGNAFSTIEVSSEPLLVTARQSAFDAASPTGAAGEVTSADAGDIANLGAELLRVDSTKSDRPDLNDADVVVSGGRGMKSGENFKVLEDLADVVGAALGASRAATDAGMVPADWQVGQTGKIVAPNLYFAVAISGAIQHLAGMKNSKTIVAINKDAEAPIFQVADYGLVATWEEAVPKLTEELKKVKEQG